MKRAFAPIARMRLYKRLCELKLLKKQAGFQGAFIDSSCVGLQFEHCADAEKFLTARGHELPITLPGLSEKKYRLSMASTGGVDAPKASEPEHDPEGVLPPTATSKGLLHHLHRLTLARQKSHLPENVLRIFHTSGEIAFDLEPTANQNMTDIYAIIRQEHPGCILSKLPECEAASLAADPALPGKFLLVPPMSLPLALPTEFSVGPADERDLDFALMKEVLCEMLGDYVCIKRESADGTVDHVFKHRKEECSRNKLVVVRSAVHHLNHVIQHRKVAFLSIVGKPREGKSTLLELIRRQLSGDDGLPLFRCSNSSEKACTAGLWVSTRGFLTKASEASPQDRPLLLLLDSEGLFADDGVHQDYCVRLFTIVGVLSSVMILNNKISNTVAEEFKTPLARLAVMYKGFFERNPWFKEHQPKVLYLARDWNQSQDLIEDFQAWQEVESRCSSEEGPLRDAMCFWALLRVMLLHVGIRFMESCASLELVSPGFTWEFACEYSNKDSPLGFSSASEVSSKKPSARSSLPLCPALLQRLTRMTLCRNVWIVDSRRSLPVSLKGLWSPR